MVKLAIVALLRVTDVQRYFQLERSKVTEITPLHFAPEVTPKRGAKLCS